MRLHKYLVTATLFISVCFQLYAQKSYTLQKALQTARANLTALVNSTSKNQLRAILTILVLAIFGLVPAATSSGIGSDVQRPLATLIIGELTSTLIFTPFLISPLYWWTNRNGNGKQK